MKYPKFRSKHSDKTMKITNFVKKIINFDYFVKIYKFIKNLENL